MLPHDHVPATPPPDQHHDGIDRRGFLKCMAWAGTGVLWSIHGGILSSAVLGTNTALAAGAEFSFVQISDSHIGFQKPANTDVIGTCREGIARINALAQPADFILHTGDLVHAAEASGFDTLEQLLKECRTKDVFYVPGEHDVSSDNGAAFLARFGKKTQRGGWHSFDMKGVHFVGLVNVVQRKDGGLGILGAEQLEWLKKDLAGLSTSTPIVVFAHIPLHAVYPEWGWGTDDGEQALSLLRRFGSVTVLNGHIHQAMQKIEGNLTFHSACSLAFPQPAPGAAPKPGPMVVPAERLRSVLGLNSVRYSEGRHPLAVVSQPLA